MKTKNKEHNENEENEEDYAIIENEYKVKYKGDLGYGSFGHVYKCHSIKTNKEFACKSEPNDTMVPQIQHEYKILKSLEGGSKNL